MSGPKSSRYSLSAAQLRAIQIEAERRRQEEIRRKKIEAAKARLHNQQSELSRLMSLAQPVLGEAFITEEIKSKMKNVLSMCRQAASSCVQGQSNEDPGALEHECKDINNAVQKLKLEMNSIYAVLPDAIKGERMKIEDSIADGFRFSLPESIRRIVSRDADIHHEIDVRLSALRALSLPQVAFAELDKLLQKAASITSVDFLENYLALDIDPFIKKCEVCAEMDYVGIRARYELLANERRVAPRDFDYSVQGIEEMKAASAALEADVMADRERAYIHEVLENAIRDMGYKLIGDRVVVRAKTGKQIKHQLYTLHGGTAIDVTFSDNGQIAMELGGISHTSREPSAEERMGLVEDMRSFCQDYERLEQKLAEHGVETNRISILPPAPEYARMINAEKYELTESTNDYEVQRNQKRETQYMHKGE